MPKILRTGKKYPNNTTPDQIMAMIYFFVVTSIYCILSIFITDSQQRIMAKVAYVLIVVIGEYFINLTLSQQMCGISQWKSTMFITLVPWILIFGVLHLFLMIFPGWSAPFSNTFGYLVAKLMGLPELMKEILVEPDKSIPEASTALESVRSDNSLFINELNTEPRTQKIDEATGEPILPVQYERPIFDKAWEKLTTGGIIKKDIDPKSKESLYHFVQMKYTISEYVWNLLTGFLVTSVSYNYILNTGCAKSPDEMKKKHDKYEEDEQKRLAEKKNREDNEPNYVQG